jgi:hypothetical protein
MEQDYEAPAGLVPRRVWQLPFAYDLGLKALRRNRFAEGAPNEWPDLTSKPELASPLSKVPPRYLAREANAFNHVTLVAELPNIPRFAASGSKLTLGRLRGPL